MTTPQVLGDRARELHAGQRARTCRLEAMVRVLSTLVVVLVLTVVFLLLLAAGVG